ncbi:L-rhamnose mutarotase [Pseudozobellia thermophila]|uniref:L-rhamnose mutarotase n=1 Tax=Pseudozobellia thermophila TaxID=192903 RepID=A0A1M6F1Y3_9FLAO|nr:L-rhamnose mutarotase [Pseudozobellia thermophila]SHI91754.1 L-rhamnose mutarotase [Pseudozobellia thermophila]
MTRTKRFCYSCDLKNDPELIEEYKAHHAPGAVPEAIVKSIKDAGIENMEIYLTGNRMFMIMEVNESFDPAKKAEMDANNPAVQKWEELMWKFQQSLPWAEKDEKWIALEKIFQL